MGPNVLTWLLTLFYLVLLCKSVLEGQVPSGACFIPTKLSEAYEELPKTLISPESPGYNNIWNEFIDPMLKNIPKNLEILNSSIEYAGNGNSRRDKLRRQQYHQMRNNVEVYYIDHFNDPSDSDVSEGIWSISFGQFVFKFTKPIPGIPDRIIFNGLLPAVGITQTDLRDWRNKYPNGKPNDEEHESSSQKEQKPHKNTNTQQEKEEQEEEEERRRLVHILPFKSSNVNKTSRHIYDQVITSNGKDAGKYFEFWVVHNDPDDTTAYAVAASTLSFSTERKRLFSTDWKDGRDYCTKYSDNTAIQQIGNCDAVQVDIDEEAVKLSQHHPYCKKIILCKGGAFKFRFIKQSYRYPLHINQISVAAAELSTSCEGNVGGCSARDFYNLVRVSVRYSKTKEESMCPHPAIHLQFDCSKHWITREDIFSEYEFKPSYFYGKDYGMEYRVIPPERIPKKGEEEVADPYSCSEKTAKHRPRFQIKLENGPIKTCCIVMPPRRGNGYSIPYYWPDKRNYKGNTGRDEYGAENKNGNDENPRTRNRIPASAVVGKAPDDKEFPSKGIIDRVVGYRMDHGMSKVEAYEKKVTQEEYEAIMKNEESVKDVADPDKHKITNDTNSKSIIHAFYVVIISLFLIGISSLFLLPHIHSVQTTS